MSVSDQKKELRKKMLDRRTSIGKVAKRKYDRSICNSLLEIIKDNNVKTVHCYLPMGMEINIIPVIVKLLDEGIKVVTPKTLPKPVMQNLILTSLNKLEKGVFGTSHPAEATEYNGAYDLIIVPGLAFDDNNNRLGYGGGYYDNFIVNHPAAKKIGIFYPFQRVTNIPLEPHDIRLDMILVDRSFTDLVF